MSQSDHRHFGGHHGVRGGRDFFQRGQQHLPHPCHRPHRQSGGHGLSAIAFVRRDGGVFGGLGGDLDDADPVGHFSQITQHGHGIGPVAILRGQLGQRARCVALHDQIEQVQNAAPVGQAQHGANLFGGGFTRAVGNRLIQQRLRITGGPFGGPCDQRQRVIGDLCAFGVGDALQHGQHGFGFDPAQVEPLATRQNCHRHLADFGGGKDELYVLGRLLQRLQQRVEGAGRQHVDLIDDVDLIAGRRGPVMHRVDDFADVADACA